VTLSGGKASVTEGSLTPGLHTITATYSGNALYNGSTGTFAQNVGFIFSDPTTGNTLIVTVPANGVSGQGTWTWISNGTTIFANVPALVQFNTSTLRIASTAPSMNALFDATSHVGQAILFDRNSNRSFIINISSFVLVSPAAPPAPTLLKKTVPGPTPGRGAIAPVPTKPTVTRGTAAPTASPSPSQSESVTTRPTEGRSLSIKGGY
jgi:hypothetical protein